MIANIEVQDVTGQKRYRVRGASGDDTVGQFTDRLLGRLNLPATSNDGQALTYYARRDRDGRHLNRTELVSDTFQDNERVTLQPDISAG